MPLDIVYRSDSVDIQDQNIVVIVIPEEYEESKGVAIRTKTLSYQTYNIKRKSWKEERKFTSKRGKGKHLRGRSPIKVITGIKQGKEGVCPIASLKRRQKKARNRLETG
eukprot:300791_1